MAGGLLGGPVGIPIGAAVGGGLGYLKSQSDYDRSVRKLKRRKNRD
tara:strand:+ start:26 stop:163 length:138 start_codon:yes stop_codon:yes gene_type:complete